MDLSFVKLEATPESSSSSSKSISPNPKKKTYDVFISFRGEDTRYNITSHLDMALRQKGINHFIDYNLEKGKEIKSSLLKNIEESMISIVVISETFASSSWCLDELVKIMECKKCDNQIVYPIFYKVSPSDVRNQTGNFGDCFAALTKDEAKFSTTKMKEWKEALSNVANSSGWSFGDETITKRETEADLIEVIVKNVLGKLNRTTPLTVADYPVGIEFQIKKMDLESSMKAKKGTTLMIGIYGLGGVGKTTLAKALYNKFFNQFEGSSFLSNVKDASKHDDGIARLQEQLISDILMDDTKVGDRNKGVNIIEKRLRSKRVLIVIDDVDSSEQLNSLAISNNNDSFGKGSLIIATSRSIQLLNAHNFDVKYELKGLSDYKALELFNWHAFRKNHPPESYANYSKRAVKYCSGLPLALVLLGSYFFKKKRSEKWEEVLDSLKNSSSSLVPEINNILQISYDGLIDQEKEAFLYISCFFIGEDISGVKKMLMGCDIYPHNAIDTLKDFSLLKIEEYNNKVQIHELIQQMGEAIIDKQDSKPSRKILLIKKRQDIIKVLNADKREDAVKAIKLSFPVPTTVNINAEAFKNLEGLRLLTVQNATFPNLDYLPESLVQIDWVRYPYSSLPSSYSPKMLRQLNLQNSSIVSLGKRFRRASQWLTTVNLSYSNFLVEIPDLSSAKNLESLHLRECKKLVKVHESVGSLPKLVTLDLVNCSSLKHLPKRLSLKSLIYLFLYGCESLKEFPDIGEGIVFRIEYICFVVNSFVNLPKSFGNLTSLKEISFEGCNHLTTLPSSIRYLTALQILSLEGCINLTILPEKIVQSLVELRKLTIQNCKNFKTLPDSIYHLSRLELINISRCPKLHLFPSSSSLETANLNLISFSSLTELSLSYCAILNLDFLETLFDIAPSLVVLDLTSNSFASLPSCIMRFKSLQILLLKDCKLLKKIPKIPSQIFEMDTRGCRSLLMFPDNIEDMISCELDYSSTRWKLSRDLRWRGRYNLPYYYHRYLILENYKDIPEWYDVKNLDGNSISFYMENSSSMKIRAFAPCVVFRVNQGSTSSSIDDEIHIKCKVFINGTRVWSSSFVFSSLSSMGLLLLVIDPPDPYVYDFDWFGNDMFYCWSDFMESEKKNLFKVKFSICEKSEGGFGFVTIKSCGVHVYDKLPIQARGQARGLGKKRNRG